MRANRCPVAGRLHDTRVQAQRGGRPEPGARLKPLGQDVVMEGGFGVGPLGSREP